MTTEDDLQAMLDAHPADHQTRGVLGDFLTDRGDPRGPGYCALAKAEAAPKSLGTRNPQWVWWNRSNYLGYVFPARKGDPRLYGDGIAHAMLPAQWFHFLRSPTSSLGTYWTRRLAEDAAALAWAALTDEQRVELLSTVEAFR